jgi:hypothetical protein
MKVKKDAGFAARGTGKRGLVGTGRSARPAAQLVLRFCFWNVITCTYNFDA